MRKQNILIFIGTLKINEINFEKFSKSFAMSNLFIVPIFFCINIFILMKLWLLEASKDSANY